jgi:hypothetical protein
LRPPEFYKERRIELLLGSRVSSIDVSARQILLEGGSRRTFGALLIATGADPVRLAIPGADLPQVHYLRSFADSRALVEKARGAKHVVVAGAKLFHAHVLRPDLHGVWRPACRSGVSWAWRSTAEFKPSTKRRVSGSISARR